MIVGMVLAFRLVTPEAVDRLPTRDLLGLLGLVVLPAFMLWALALDRRTSSVGTDP